MTKDEKHVLWWLVERQAWCKDDAGHWVIYSMDPAGQEDAIIHLEGTKGGWGRKLSSLWKLGFLVRICQKSPLSPLYVPASQAADEFEKEFGKGSYDTVIKFTTKKRRETLCATKRL
jgi:hypothetical protein